MEQKILFSIIMPIYNAERYLKKAISSIISQTLIKWELILVNDGSTDSSDTICKQFLEDTRIRYFILENGGPLRARCFGAKQAQGEYILFCDADDYYLNVNCFKRLETIIKTNPVDLIQFGNIKKYHILHKKECSVSVQELADRNTLLKRDYPKLLCSFWDKSKLTLCVWNKAYHRRLIDSLPDANQFDHVFMGDDLIFNLYVLQNCQMVLFLPDILYCYRANAGYSKKWNKETMYDLNTIKSYQRQFLNDYKGDDKDSVEEIMYSEVTGWLLVHIKDGINKIDAQEMYQYLTEVLQLQQFQYAREYYLQKTDVHFPAVDFMRKGDPQLYIEFAYEEANNDRIRKKIRGLMRRII